LNLLLPAASKSKYHKMAERVQTNSAAVLEALKFSTPAE
jgi:hypothetical protein